MRAQVFVCWFSAHGRCSINICGLTHSVPPRPREKVIKGHANFWSLSGRRREATDVFNQESKIAGSLFSGITPLVVTGKE